MPKSVLIILAAVVVLIAVVVILGMRYLRSDDEEFDDGGAAGQGHDRHVPAARGRRGHDDFDAQRDLPRPSARSGAAARDTREARPRQAARSGRGDYDADRTELVPASGRTSRSQPGARRDAAARRDARGRGPAARPGGWDEQDRRDSDVRDRRDGRVTRTAPAVREMAVPGLDELDRRDARPARDRTGRDQQEELLPAVKPRQAKSKSSKRDPDWPTNEWDELSDVDYWTELAADKPFTTDAPAAARANGAERGSAELNGTPSLDVTQRLDQPLLPDAGRDRLAHDRRSDRTGARRDPDRRTRGDVLTSTGPRRAVPDRAAAQRMEPARSRHAAPLDDDPLTSPSFPRIDANDSRSYRHSRSGSHQRPAAGSEYAAAPTNGDLPAGAYARPAADGYRNATASHDLPLPDSYLTPARNGAGRHGADPLSPDYSYDTSQYGSTQYGAGRYGAGQYGASQYGTSQHSVSQHSVSQYGASQYGASQYEPAQHGTAPAGYDAAAARHDYAPSYGADPLGYSGYGSQGHYGGYDSLTSGYAGQDHAGAGYPPASLAEPAYPYQPPSPQPGHPGNGGGYAGADPYAVDPYGYGNTSY